MQYLLSKEISNKYLEKKSSFTAYLFFFNDGDDIQKHISYVAKKHKDARHIPYAYRYIDHNGDIQEMYSDDGEPAKTAGYSALRVLQQQDVVNVCVVIARTFGGVKLGTSGLMRAFATSCQEALDLAQLEKYIPQKTLELHILPNQLGIAESFCKQKNISYIVQPISSGSDAGKLKFICTLLQSDDTTQSELRRLL